MFPVLATFTFLSLPLLAVFVGVYAAGRLALPMRSAFTAHALPALGGAIAAIAAALAGMVAWTGTITLTSYALFLLAGTIAGYALALPKARRAGIDEQHVVRIALIALVAGVLGARARWVWENRATLDGPLVPTLLDLESGGMVWYGGMILGTLASALYAWRAGLGVLRMADLVAPSLALGLAIGRIGCFLNGCCYGRVADLPWCVVQPGHPDHPSHPTQLYESAAALALCLGLSWLYRRGRQGLTTAAFCIGYGAWRCFAETLRDDYRHPGTVGAYGSVELTNSQVTSLILIAVGVVLAAVAWRRPGPAPASVDDPARH